MFLLLSITPSVVIAVLSTKLLLSPVEKIGSPSIRESFKNSMEIARDFADRLERDAADATRRLADRLGRGKRLGGLSSQYLETIVPDAGADFLCFYERIGEGWHLVRTFPSEFDRIDSMVTVRIEGIELPRSFSFADQDLIASCLPVSRDTLLVAGIALQPGQTTRMRKTGMDLSLYGSASEWVRTMRLYITIILSMIVLAAGLSATLFSRALAKRISSPIRELANATKHLASGDLSYRVKAKAKDEIGLLVDSFNKMAEQLKANRDHIIAMTRRQAQIDRDFEIARQVQTNLFPKTLPQKKSWEFAGKCLPARAVGGDYYDVFEIAKDKVLIAQGDVCGKGLGASLVMASIHAVIRSLATIRATSPKGIVDEINRYLIEASASDTFVTLFIGIIDCEKGLLTYMNCGHPPAILLKRDGSIEKLDAQATVLGILSEYNPSETTCSFEHGDCLVIVSDGVTEALNKDDEMFEEERLLRTVRKNREHRAEELLDAILRAVRTFMDGCEQADDISILSIKHNAPWQ